MVRGPMKKRKPNTIPEWVSSFVTSKFYDECETHQELRKSEKNIFCIECGRCFCHHCFSSSHHKYHQQLPIRKYVHNNVVRVDVMQKHMDCSDIQDHLANSAKVILLRPRTNLKPTTESSVTTCEICSRFVQENYRFCSIACKVSESAEGRNQISSSVPSTSDPVSGRKRRRKGIPRRAPFF